MVVTSVEDRVKYSPGALYVTDRGGVSHRIEVANPVPIQLTLSFPENLMSLKNDLEIRLDEYLLDFYKLRKTFILMESTRVAAYQVRIKELDQRILTGKGRLEHEPSIVEVVFHIDNWGTYTDWGTQGSTVWEG